MIRIDDTPVEFVPIRDGLGMAFEGTADLARGVHRLEITHHWANSNAGLEVFWRTAEGRWRVVGPDVLLEG
jgi:hypothetical protein